jgi:hypothetical protein
VGIEGGFLRQTEQEGSTTRRKNAAMNATTIGYIILGVIFVVLLLAYFRVRSRRLRG